MNVVRGLLGSGSLCADLSGRRLNEYRLIVCIFIGFLVLAFPTFALSSDAVGIDGLNVTDNTADASSQLASGTHTEDIDSRLQSAAKAFLDHDDVVAEEILIALDRKGVVEASVLLGYLYSDPVFENRDDRKAASFFERAAKHGNAEALFQLSEIERWPGGGIIDLFSRPELDAFRLGAIEKGHKAALLRLGHECWFRDRLCEQVGSLGNQLKRLNFGHYRPSIMHVFRIHEFIRDQDTDYSKLILGILESDPFSIFFFHVAAAGAEPGQCEDYDDETLILFELQRRNGFPILPLSDFPNGQQLIGCLAEWSEARESTDQWVMNHFDSTYWYFRYCDGVSQSIQPLCYSRANWDDLYSCRRFSIAHYFSSSIGPKLLYEKQAVRLSVRYQDCRKFFLGKNRND